MVDRTNKDIESDSSVKIFVSVVKKIFLLKLQEDEG